MALTDSEIKTIVDEEIRGAVGYTSSELSNQRKLALDYYYGEKFGNEVEGRSEYVSRDVADTIEWIMPHLMSIFYGGDTIVRFEPQGPEDEQNAQQATDYINYIFQRKNDGFLTLYTWMKDALLSKNGFVKVYWENYQEYKTETYSNLTEDEFAEIGSQPGIEIVGYDEEESVDGLTGVVDKSISLKIRKNDEKGRCCVIPVPPEEMLVNRYPVAPLKKNRFVCHRRRVTTSELVEMELLSKVEAEKLPSYEDMDFNEERTARFAYDDTDQSDASGEKSTKYVWLAEAYIRVDADEDGVAELRKVILAGDRVLANEEVDSLPFATMTPIILPHKLFGMSIADLVMDLQLLKSTVFRQILDNMYLTNNGRYMALDGMVNIDDLLTSRPGGIVRVKTFDAVKPMQAPLLGAPAFELLGYIDAIKENRTGVTRAPVNPDVISKFNNATAASIFDQATQARIVLIARIFAETGVKDLFGMILENVQKHQNRADVIRLRNEWVPMDPREWTNKFDLEVMVGLGTGSKETQLMALNEETQFQLGALQAGIPIVTPENLYNLRMKALEAKNVKGGDLFYTHPQKMPPAPPQQDPSIMKAQIDGQVKTSLQEMKAQHALEKQAMKQEFDAEKTQFKAMMDSQAQAAEHAAQMMAQAREHASQSIQGERAKEHELLVKILEMLQENKNNEAKETAEESAQ